MKTKILKTSKPVAFATIEDASQYLAGLADGEYEIEVSTKRTEFVIAFTDAMSRRRDIAKRLKTDQTVFFDWRLIGPATYSIHVSGNALIPVVWKSKADDLRDRINALADGERLDCSSLGYDAFYIRVVLTKLDVQAYTKTENGTMYIVKGSKPLSALKTIQAFASSLGDNAQILYVDKPVQYVRTNLSKIKTSGFRFSVKEMAYGQYLVSKRYDRPAKVEGGFSRAYLASVLSPEDLAAYDAIMDRAKAAGQPSNQALPDWDIWPAEDPAYNQDTTTEADAEGEADPLIDLDPSAEETPANDGFVESAPCYMVPDQINDKPSAPDPDEWEAKNLNTDYISKMMGDDDDLPF